jgi:gamma-glutamyl-gamma-aminobutyrate hydrolase PuuD
VFAEHDVRLEHGSLAARAVGARSALDDGFVLGVLWHPEEDDASEVIGALVRAAAEALATAASRTRR